MLDRIPRDALDRALQAEVAYRLYVHLVYRGDPRCVVELDQVLALGADGVHPYLVALATQHRVLLVALFDPVRAGPMLDEAAVARDAIGDPTIEMAHALAGLMLRGVTQGDMTLASPYIDELERLRSVLPNSGYALHADIWTAVAADHVGDLARASDCLERAEQWLAEHSRPGAPALRGSRGNGNATASAAGRRPRLMRCSPPTSSPDGRRCTVTPTCWARWPAKGCWSRATPPRRSRRSTRSSTRPPRPGC